MVEALSSGADPATLLATLVPMITGGLVLFVANIVLGALAVGMGIVVTDALLRGERPSFDEAFTRFKPRFGSLLGTYLLIMLATMGIIVAGALLMVLLIPLLVALVLVIYLVVRWAVAMPVAVLEERRATENLRRSSELTAGSRWAILGLYVVLALVVLIPSLILVMPFTLATMPDLESVEPGTYVPSTGTQVTSWALTTALQLVIGFVMAAALVLLYRKLSEPPAEASEPEWTGTPAMGQP